MEEKRARPVRRPAAWRQSVRGQLKARKRRRRIITSISTVVILAGGAYGVYFHGIGLQSITARSSSWRTAPMNAKAAFLELEDYHNSAEMVLESVICAQGRPRTGNLPR